MVQQIAFPLEIESCPDSELLLPESDLYRRHTAERVNQVSERRDAILRALGCGIPFASICEVFACAPATVAAIASQHPGSVEAGKERLAGKFRTLSHLAVDRCIEAVVDGSMPVQSLPVCAGIAADKSLQLAGEPVLVVEHRHTADPRMLQEIASRWIDSQSSVSVPGGVEIERGDAVLDVPALPAPGCEPTSRPTSRPAAAGGSIGLAAGEEGGRGGPGSSAGGGMTMGEGESAHKTKEFS